MLQHQNTRGSSKSNTAVLFNRYVWLVDTIYRAGRLSFEEINERWVRSSLIVRSPGGLSLLYRKCRGYETGRSKNLASEYICCKSAC